MGKKKRVSKTSLNSNIRVVSFTCEHIYKWDAPDGRRVFQQVAQRKIFGSQMISEQGPIKEVLPMVLDHSEARGFHRYECAG